jgi:hypothetical protein
LKLEKLYQLIVQKGMENDPRGKKQVEAELKKKKAEFAKLKQDERADYDQEALVNPYADTRILAGSLDTQIKSLLIGIDIEVGEVLLADRLREKGSKIDCLMSHHPEGYALAGFYEVMRMQADILGKMGVPINVAEDMLAERIKEVERKIMPLNHARSSDVAKILGIPFLCCHTPADNCVTSFLQELMDKKKPETVGDVLALLKEIPEYQKASKEKAGPRILLGDPKRKAGKVFVEMTGGTEGAKEIFPKLAQAGVGTLVLMHLSEEHFKKAQPEHINVVIAGHIASDNLGLNLMLDELSKTEKLKITACSGFRRVER